MNRRPRRAPGVLWMIVVPEQIHIGSCGAGEPVMFPLNTMVTDSSGRAIAGTGIPDTGSLNGNSVQIHGADFRMTACGTIGGNG